MRTECGVGVVEHPRSVLVVATVLHQRIEGAHLGPPQQQLRGAAERRATSAATIAT